MKNSTFLFCLFLCIPLFIKAQDVHLDKSIVSESEVPQAVLANQNTFFSGGFITEWQLQKDLNPSDDKAIRYISTFKENGVPGYTASYLPDGTLLFHSKFYKFKELPDTIRLKLRFDYKNFEVDHADFITAYKTKRSLYRVHLRNGTLFQYAFYDTNSKEIDSNSLPPEFILFHR